MPIHDSADRWNHRNPPGTPVRVRLANGTIVDDLTASKAEQWGSHAIVTLQGRPGMWTTATLAVSSPNDAEPDSTKRLPQRTPVARFEISLD